MSNENNELQLGMSVDTAEGLQNVKQFGSEFKQSVSEMKGALADASKTEFGENIAEGIGEANITVQEFYDWIRRLEEEWLNTPMFTKEWHELGDSIKMVKEEISKAKSEFAQSNNLINTSRVQTGAFRTAVTQSTYALREFHPALGSAVSALSPMITGLNTASVRGQGFKAMLATVGSQLIGPLGIVAGIGILTTVITTLIRTKKSAVDITKEYAAEIQQLRSEIEKMSRGTLELALNNVLRQQSDLVGEVVKKGGDLTEEQYKQSKLLKEQEAIIKNQLRTIGDIATLENERTELNEKIKELRNIDANQGMLSPRNLALLEQYQNRVKQIEGTLDRIRGKQKKEKAEKEIFLSDEQLLEKLKAIDVQLAKTNLSERERNILLADRIKIINELNSIEQKRINQLIQRDIDASIADDDILFGDLSGDALAQGQRRSNWWGDSAGTMLSEQIRQGGLLKQIYVDIGDAATDAGRSLIGAWTSSINLIQRNKTMLEQFINEMARAVFQAIALRLATTFIGGPAGILSSIFGGGSAASAVQAIPSMPGGGGMAMKSLIPTPGSFGVSGSSQIMLQPVVMETTVRGRDLHLIQKKQTDYRQRYM